MVPRLRRQVQPPLPWLAVLGPDGSGKSTVLAGVRDGWPPSLGPVHIYHLRPRRLNRRGGPAGPVVDPHGQPPRGAVLSAAALAFVVADWWFGYWTDVAPRRTRHGLVLFDRHLLDVLVDPLRYRYGGPTWLARLACRLVPRPDLVVILDACPAVVRARKQEVTPAESERQWSAYRRLAATTPGAHLVDASGPAEQVVQAVLAVLLAEAQKTGAGRAATA